MEQIIIGGSDLKTSRIGLGTWAIGGWMWGGIDDAQSIATIRAAVERGVTLIDTAPVYGFGHAEEVVGKALAADGLRRRVHIASKLGVAWAGGKPFRDASPGHVRREIEDSLRRLRTDVIDLYQVHWPDPHTPIEDTAAVLEQLRREGKIRAIGVSNFTPTQMQAFRAAAKLDAVQFPYNLFERDIENDVLPYAMRTGLTLLSYGSLCRGLLAGSMTLDSRFAGDDLRNIDPKFQGRRFSQYLTAVEQLKALARDRFGRSVLELAVRWVLDQGPTLALWGARRPHQLQLIDQIDGWHIDARTSGDIDTILARCITDPASPEFMAPPPRAPATRQRTG